MNDLTAAALARADAEESTLYFVVPLIGPADNVIPCAYFNARWERIPSPKPLDTVNTNAIMFAQQSVGLSPEVLAQLGNSKPDTSVTLFVAVAKTLEKPSGLPNTFVATGLVWQWVLNPGSGLQNAMQQLGWSSFQFDWIVDQDRVIYTVVIAGTWQGAGLVMALMLAGLRGIDEEIWKAARLDGIPTWRVYLSVVLPMMGPTLATVFTLLAVSVVKVFDTVVAMTQGGPGNASDVPVPQPRSSTVATASSRSQRSSNVVRTCAWMCATSSYFVAARLNACATSRLSRR